MIASFLERTNDRVLHADFRGDIFIWDIDKTYLDTHFSSLRGLLAIPFEFAVDKHAVPGTVPLLRALRHGPLEESGLHPLYFISGSPKHLRRIVERKMTLDGVQFDGITFKDQLGLLKARRPKGITEQVGYKLRALLLYRRDHPAGVRYWLFGDDVEKDLTTFLLFGEVCAGLRGPALGARLMQAGVHRNDAVEAVSLADALAVEPDPVAAVFIHEVRGKKHAAPNGSTDPRVHTAKSFLDHARTLHSLGKIRASDIDHVALETQR